MGNLTYDPNLPSHYRRKIKLLAYEYNRKFPLPYYFGPLIHGKKEVNIADLGSGPICILGNIWGDIKINLFPSDNKQPSYAKLLKHHKINLLTPVEYQDMENLTYPDEFFDVVHCVNALDHTKNVKKAIEEMKRVCKKNGYIYLRHAPNQRRAHHGLGHYWDAGVEGFSDGESLIQFDGFTSRFDGNFIVSIYRKA